MAETLSSILGKSCDFSGYHENLLEATKMYRLADINKKIHNEMQAKGLKTEMLLHPQILDILTRFLGPDLAYARAGQIFINLESENNPVYKIKMAPRSLVRRRYSTTSSMDSSYYP